MRTKCCEQWEVNYSQMRTVIAPSYRFDKIKHYCYETLYDAIELKNGKQWECVNLKFKLCEACNLYTYHAEIVHMKWETHFSDGISYSPPSFRM